MGKSGYQPWLKFYPDDWVMDEALARCSLAAQGLLVRLLAVLHRADPYGYLIVPPDDPEFRGVARAIGVNPKAFRARLRELEEKGVLRHDERGLYLKRMVVDEERRKRARECGGKGGNPALTKGEDLMLNPEAETQANASSIINLQKGENSSEQPEKPHYEGNNYEPEVYELAHYLWTFVCRNHPATRAPDMEKWAEIMDRIFCLDGKTYQQIKNVIEWSQNDRYWKSKIRSPRSLRQNFDIIEGQIKQMTEAKIREIKKRLQLIKLDEKIGAEK